MEGEERDWRRNANASKIRWEINSMAREEEKRREEEEEGEASEGEKRSQRMAGGCGRMEEGRSARFTPLEPFPVPPPPAIPASPPRPGGGTLLPLPGRHLLGDFPRHLREGANETLGVGIDPRRRPGDARSKTPGLPGARERHRSSR